MVAEDGNFCEYDRKGSVLVARDGAQAKALREHVATHRAAGVECSHHESDWAEIEPVLGPAATAVGWWPGDAQVQPMLACYQIAQSLAKKGARYRFYAPLASIVDTPVGVSAILQSGERIEAGYLCLCAGVWTNEVLASLGVRLPVRPRKGQVCVLERGPVTVRTKVTDFSYISTVEDTAEDDTGVQTAAVIESTQSGTILCGSSREFAGFDTGVDTTVLGRILRDCIDLVPALGELRVIRGYAGLRPHSPDGLPIVGPVTETGRIVVATGHEGAGHCLAPVTGEIVADLIAGAPATDLTAVLDAGRFPQ
jgi:glycine/D-amino acid oxidase-like deaminating enzyme